MRFLKLVGTVFSLNSKIHENVKGVFWTISKKIYLKDNWNLMGLYSAFILKHKEK